MTARRRGTLAAGLLAASLLPAAEGLPGVVFVPALGLSGLVALLVLADRLPPRAGPRLAALCLSSVLALVLADLGLRGFVADLLGDDPHVRFLHRWPRDDRLLRCLPGRSFDGELPGDLAAMSGRPEHRERRRIRFETGPRGFRHVPPPCPGPLDLLLLGDSFGMGSGTSQEETWEALFRRRWGWRVANLSLPGSPWTGLVNLKAELDHLPVRPGAIVLWALYTGNDLDEAYHDDLAPRHAGWLRQRLVAWRTLRDRSPLRRLLERWRRRKAASVLERRLPDGRTMLFYEPYTRRARRRESDVREHPHYRQLVAVFREMARFARERRLRVAVALIPTKAEVYSWALDGRSPGDPPVPPSGMARVVEALCREQGFPFADLAPPLVLEAGRLWRERRELLWWRDDTHWNGRGHELAATLVHERLLRP